MAVQDSTEYALINGFINPDKPVVKPKPRITANFQIFIPPKYENRYAQVGNKIKILPQRIGE